MRAAIAVAMTYGYFLLFAEFAFLKHVRAVTGEGGDLRIVMACLAGGGLTGSLLAWRCFRVERWAVSLAASYVACAVAAAVAPWASGVVALAMVATGTGLALGWNTVTLAGGLRGLVPARLGWASGLGTGLAYAFCNIPAVFLAGATAQALASAAIACVGAVAVWRSTPGDLPPPPSADARAWPWVLIFLALVWLDSAAFLVIQQTPDLRRETWSGSVQLWGNAAIHFVAAAGAGALLDRGWLRPIAGAAWLALALACLSLVADGSNLATGMTYAAGVSLYSTALVFFAARDRRPGVAAAVFAVAGWIGSGLGIVMAQNLHGVPAWFVAVSGAAVAVALRPWPRAGLLVLALLVFVRPMRADDSGVRRGREVYIAEGCMHCHSQYVRAGVAADVERWGPAQALEDFWRAGSPLPGNRRQGPDLTNVGNRRSPEWNRLHLEAPRSVSPGSRMPSYRLLFAAGNPRGEDLLAFLASLGASTVGKHWEIALAWRPPPAVVAIDREEAARLFGLSCTPCHGRDGRGDGALASRLPLPPPNWSRDPWRHLPDGDETGLARVIKFGTPGTTMAGHEAFTDAEILGLARYVKGLHQEL